MRLSELLALHRRCHGRSRLLESVGDGYLYLHNPYFRRVRDAALSAGYRYATDDSESYFGFPLIHLDTILRSRKIPYRPSFAALEHLERSRPGFFELRDLRKNRPAPNYLLHESAHAVAFRELFGKPRDVRATLAEDTALLGILLGEAYAMTAEYFAACAVEGSVHDWFFSISSYRHRTPKKKAVGELVLELGLPLVARCVLLAFLLNNFLVDRIDARRFDVLTGLVAPRLRSAQSARLREALNGLMVMDPEFRYDTARLFLTMFGRKRDIRRELAGDPLKLFGEDTGARAAVDRLIQILAA